MLFWKRTTAMVWYVGISWVVYVPDFSVQMHICFYILQNRGSMQSISACHIQKKTIYLSFNRFYLYLNHFSWWRLTQPQTPEVKAWSPMWKPSETKLITFVSLTFWSVYLLCSTFRLYVEVENTLRNDCTIWLKSKLKLNTMKPFSTVI